MILRAWKAIAATALILAALSVLLTAVLFARIASESHDRRSQECVFLETQQAKAVENLRRTYDYLEHLTPAQRHEPLNRAIRQALPVAESDAKAPVPAYCNEPGIGLPEPGPAVPKRPKGF